MKLERLIELVTEGVRQTPEERRALEGMLGGFARVDEYLKRRTRKLGELVDPALVPANALRFLAHLVGLGPELGAANAASADQLRALIPIATRLWRMKGGTPSWTIVLAALASSRALILDWFYYRTVSGSSAMVHTIPGVEELDGVGGLYSYPERVTDVWIADATDGGVDLDLIGRWLDVLRPGGERINVRTAMQVDDGGAGAALWAGSGAGSWSYDAEAYALSTIGEYEYRQALGGLELEATNHAGFFRLAVTGQASIRFLYEGSDDHYELAIDQPGAAVALYRWEAGVRTLIGAAVQPLAAGFAYRWTVEAWGERVPGGPQPDLSLRVTWEGRVLVDVVDSSPTRPSRGPWSWGSTAPGSSATLSAFLHRRQLPGAARVGPNP